MYICMCEQMNKIKNNKKNIRRCAKLTYQLLFNTRFKKVDVHTRGTWLNHDNKHHKGNELERLKFPCTKGINKNQKYTIH